MLCLCLIWGINLGVLVKFLVLNRVETNDCVFIRILFNILNGRNERKQNSHTGCLEDILISSMMTMC